MSETLATNNESIVSNAKAEVSVIDNNAEIIEAAPEAAKKQSGLNRLANFFLNMAAKTELLDGRFQEFKIDTGEKIDNATEKAKEVTEKIGYTALAGVDVVIGLGVMGSDIVSANYKKAETQVSATAEKISNKVASTAESTKTFVTDKATKARNNAASKIDSVGNFFNDKLDAAKAYAKKLHDDAETRKMIRSIERDQKRDEKAEAAKARIEKANSAKFKREQRHERQKAELKEAYDKKAMLAKEKVQGISDNVFTFLMRTRATGQAARQAAGQTWKNYGTEK